MRQAAITMMAKLPFGLVYIANTRKTRNALMRVYGGGSVDDEEGTRSSVSRAIPDGAARIAVGIWLCGGPTV
jgi:hypothetical protein